MTPALRFLTTIWPEGPPAGQDLLLWTLDPESQAKRSRWGHDLEALSARALDLAPRFNVYVGVGAGQVPEGTFADGTPRHKVERLSADQVLTVPGHVADIDYGEIGHKKPGRLFRSPEEATEFLGSLPLAPTVTVHSGGGLQAWWLYHEPWEIGEERAAAEAVSHGWTELMKDEAKAVDRSLDSAFDLSRVFRVPGTSNHKAGLVREVRLIRADGPRYDPTDFEPWTWTGVEVRPEWLSLEPSPGLDAAEERFEWWPKLQALCDLDPKFRQTWQYKRSPAEMPSTSEYDLALATKMWAAAWSEQEILDALIVWRRSRGLDPKKLPYYLRYTIPKAAASEWATADRESLKIHETVLEASQKGEAPELEREKILEQVRRELGVPVKRLERDADIYSLVLTSGVALRLGGREQVQQQQRWRAIAWEQQVSLRKLKSNAWDRVLDLLALIVEDHTTPEITAAGELLEWIASHRDREALNLDEFAAGRERNIKLAELYKAEWRWGYREGGAVVIFGPALLAQLNQPGSSIPMLRTAAELQVRLRSLGATSYAKTVVDEDGKRVKRCGWRLDSSLFDPVD